MFIFSVSFGLAIQKSVAKDVLVRDQHASSVEPNINTIVRIFALVVNMGHEVAYTVVILFAPSSYTMKQIAALSAAVLKKVL